MEHNSRLDLEFVLRDKGVSKETLKRLTIEDHRNTIAQEVGDSWESLATFIGVSSVDVDDIKEKYKEPLDRRLAMMRRWHELLGSKATYCKLIKGLRQIGRRDLIECILLSHQPPDMLADKHHKFPVPWLKVVYYLFLLVVVAVISALGGTIVIYKATLRIDFYDDRTEQTQESKFIVSSNPQKINFDLETSVENCSFPENDLPVIHPLFMGRENDVHQVLHKMVRAHIVNINGAPGFGKSTLAIHVGYEIFRKNRTSVRYVNVEDKVSSILDQLHKSENKVMSESCIKTESDTDRVQASSLIEHHSHCSLSMQRIQKYKEESFLEELQTWSERINCTSVLILDNCDDILRGIHRHKFLNVMNSLITRSHFQLHIIIVSHERLLYLDSFDYWTVRELNQSASVELLDQLAPAINNKSLTAAAELVEGCPLALKVIGQLLHIHGAQLIKKLEKDLLAILDEVSVPEQRLRVILDIAFNRLGIFKDCGYILSLFPGTFDESAGKGIVQEECLETYLKYSLLNDFYVTFNYRYKMHRLIKEYLQEKISISDDTTFRTRFRKHFETMLLKFAIKQEINDAEKNKLLLELHNLYYLRELVLTDIHSSSNNLAVLAYLFDINLIELEKLRRYYGHYIIKVSTVCPLLNPKLCGQVYSDIVSHLYHHHKCETLRAYIMNFFVSPCMEHFQCEVVEYLQVLYTSGILNVSEEELSYIDLVANINAHCSGRQYKYIGSIFNNILWSAALMCFALYASKCMLAVLSFIMWSMWLGMLIINVCAFNHQVYNKFRIFEIVLTLLCHDATMYIAVLLMHIPKLTLSKQKYIVFADLILLISYSSIIYFTRTYHKLSVPCYFCQFIPICV